MKQRIATALTMITFVSHMPIQVPSQAAAPGGYAAIAAGNLSKTDAAAVKCPYRVFVDGVERPVRPARTSAYPFNREWPGRQRPLDQTEISWFVSFDVAGPAALEVEVDGCAAAPEIRPREFGLECAATAGGGRWRVSLDGPRSFVMLPHGFAGALHVFANPPFEEPEMRPGDPPPLRFGPGEHFPGRIFPEDNQTVVIEEGAIVHGAVMVLGRSGVRVVGRGVLDASCMFRCEELRMGASPAEMAALEAHGFPMRELFLVSALNARKCSGLLVEGIVVLDAPFWAVVLQDCTGATLRNVKVCGQWRYNSDGIDVCGDSRDITVEGCFVRSFDDCLVVRTGCEGIEFRDNVLWCDWGKCLEVWSGGAGAIRGIRFLRNHAVRTCSHAVSVDAWPFSPGPVLVEDVLFEDNFLDLTGDPPLPNYQVSDGERYAADASKVDPPAGVFLAVSHGDPEASPTTYRRIVFRRLRVHGEPPRVFIDRARLRECADVAFEDCDLKGEGR